MSRTVILHGGPHDGLPLCMPDAWADTGSVRIPRLDDRYRIVAWLTYKPAADGEWRLFDVEDA